MRENKELSTIELINRGWLMVNIPAVIIILIIWYCLIAYVELNGQVSAIIGGAIGWLYWGFAIKRWVKWALDNNIEPDRLLKVGKSSLLLWNRRIIDEVLNKQK